MLQNQAYVPHLNREGEEPTSESRFMRWCYFYLNSFEFGIWGLCGPEAMDRFSYFVVMQSEV